jgi:hypothetical protein
MKLITVAFIVSLLFFSISLSQTAEKVMDMGIVQKPTVTEDLSPDIRGGSISLTEALWDLQLSWVPGFAGGEAGMETDGNYFYTTQWNAGSGTFYKYEMDGTYLGPFTIAGCQDIRDLAYDGQYFYGAAANTTLYILDLANEVLIGTIPAPVACRAIAYNEDLDAFIANNWSDAITTFDRNGTVISSFLPGTWSSYYGFAYDNISESGPYLWGFSQDGSGAVIVQMNYPSGTETGVTFDVNADLGTPGGLAGGLFTTPDVVAGTFSIGGTVQNLMMFVYELAPYGDPLDPLPPTNFTTYSDYSTPTSMALTWTDPTTLINGTPINTSDFTIEIERDGTPLTSVAGGTGNYTDTGLNDGQLYEYAIYTKLVANDSTSATKRASWTAGGAGQPMPPTAFGITDPGTGLLRAHWTNPSHNVDGTPMDDFAAINLYEDGGLLTTFTRTPADTGRADSADFTPTAGTHIDYLTAVDNETPPFESDPSNSSVSLVPPIMTVTPLNIIDTLLVNEIKVLNISIANNQIDPSTLHFTISESPPSGWLTANPVSGTIPSNGQMSIEVTLDATSLPTGPYVAELVVNGNDPNNPEDRIQINMRVNPAPVIGFNPPSMQFAVLVNEADSAQMTIYNNGAGVLEFELTDKDLPGENALARVVDRSYLRSEFEVEIPKGQPDWRSGTPQIEGSGGPDLYGYTWIDSDEPGGPVFNWIDISATGTEITGLADDNHVGPFPIGFTFNFYGNDYTEFYVQSNGLVNFDNSYITLSNYQIPLADSYNNLIAWLWDDMDPGNALTHVYYQTMGNMLVIQFAHYFEFPDGGAWVDAEMILYSNGNIKIQYDYFDPTFDLLGCTVGIENIDGTDGLQVAYNGAYLHGDLALLFTGDSQWLSENPTSGTIPPGGNMDIWVTANSDGILGGEYFANVIINSNDPLTPDTSMLVHMTVIGIPDISTNPDSIFFSDSLFVGASETKSLQIVNSGNGVLNVANITSTNSVFTLDTTHFRVPPLHSFNVGVIFTPPAAGNFSGTLQISNDDPLFPLLEVPVEGGAIPAPQVVITPNFQIPISIHVDDSIDVSVTIANTGGNPLEWSASARRSNLAYASDLSMQQFIKFNLNSPADTSMIASTVPAGLVEGDFNNEGIFYAIDLYSNSLVSVDTSTGIITTIGTMQPATWTGLAHDPSSGIWYAMSSDISTTSTLYIIDPTSGVTTMIGSTTDAPVIVGIAIDNSGNMYAHDIALNMIFSIDKTTGAATQIGPTGITAFTSYQDMDFNPATNVLYLASYNSTTGSELHIVDVVTGSATLIGPIGTGLSHISAFAISGAYSSWIKLLEPTSGTVNPANQVDLQVRLYGMAEMRDTTLIGTIAISTNDPINPLVIVDVIVEVITGIKDQNVIPTEFMVFQNYPNPFNPSTTIEFDLPKTSKVTLKIFNILGEEVTTLVSDRLSAGSYSYEWDAISLASGIYLYRLEAEEYVETKKMMLLK